MPLAGPRSPCMPVHTWGTLETGQVTTAMPSMPTTLSPSLEGNVAAIRQALGNPPDLQVRPFRLVEGTRCAAMFLQGMADTASIALSILEPAVHPEGAAAPAPPSRTASRPEARPHDKVQVLQERLLTTAGVARTQDLQEAVAGILDGKTVLLVDGEAACLVASTLGYKSRDLQDPITEGVVRGPREGFTEDLEVNVTLLRRRLRTSRLRFEALRLGRVSRTRVYLAYLQGVARPDIVAEVRRRLDGIDIDNVGESGFIEELIEDHPLSLFPQIERTERPDKVAAALAEGRVAVLTDNTPFVLVVPSVFFQFLQTPEDYYERFFIAIALRWVRFLSFALALALPALYVAVVTMHQELLPTGLAVAIAASRQGVPLPAAVEAFMMEAIFEIMREAGVRLPRPVGQAVSVVGGIVVGEAAVRAGIVSSPAVIIVSLTGIASFAVPAYNMMITLRILRFGLILLAGSMGIPGLTAGILLTLTHLAGLRSFGVPFLAPVAPAHYPEQADVIARPPLWIRSRRPQEWALDRRPAAARQKPVPPHRDRPRGSGS